MFAKLKPTGDESAPYVLLLKGKTKTEKRLLQSWYEYNPLGESICTVDGWLRLRVIGVKPVTELRSEYLPELTKPQRVEAMKIRQVLKQQEVTAQNHADRFKRATATANRSRIVEWLESYKRTYKRKNRCCVHWTPKADKECECPCHQKNAARTKKRRKKK